MQPYLKPVDSCRQLARSNDVVFLRHYLPKICESLGVAMARSPGMRGIFLRNEEAKKPKILKITGYGCTKVGDNDAYANRHHPLSPSRLPQLPSASRNFFWLRK